MLLPSYMGFNLLCMAVDFLSLCNNNYGLLRMTIHCGIYSALIDQPESSVVVLVYAGPLFINRETGCMTFSIGLNLNVLKLSAHIRPTANKASD